MTDHRDSLRQGPESYRLRLSSADGVHRVLSLCRRRRYELLSLTYRGDERTLELSIASQRSREERPGVVPAPLTRLTALVEVVAAERLGPNAAGLAADVPAAYAADGRVDERELYRIEARAGHLRSLRRRIARGQYRVDSRAIAESILKRLGAAALNGRRRREPLAGVSARQARE